MLFNILRNTKPLISFPKTPFSTIFGKIARKEIKADIVYEDDKCLAFKDINPQAPTHIVLIPKIEKIDHLNKVEKEDKELLGHLLYTAAQVAKQQNIDQSGWRLVINDGKHGQQTVNHLHLHIIGGRQLKWPPG